MYQPRGNAPLDQMAQLLGLPGKLGMDGSAGVGGVPGRQASRRSATTARPTSPIPISSILRFQLMRGALTAEQYRAEMRPGANHAGQVAPDRTGRNSSVWTVAGMIACPSVARTCNRR